MGNGVNLRLFAHFEPTTWIISLLANCECKCSFEGCPFFSQTMKKYFIYADTRPSLKLIVGHVSYVALRMATNKTFDIICDLHGSQTMKPTDFLDPDISCSATNRSN